MNHAFIDRYARLKSPIHNLKSSQKLLSAFSMLALLLLGLPLLNFGNALFGILLYGFWLLMIAIISRIPLTFLFSRSALVLPFSALIVIVNFYSGNFEFDQMIVTLFKSFFSVFTLLLLTSTTAFNDILKQLSQWGMPRLLITILAFMYRYFFLLLDEIEALERAVQMRHSSVTGWKRIKVYSNIIGVLLIHSFERAENVYQAMQMRGFSGDLS